MSRFARAFKSCVSLLLVVTCLYAGGHFVASADTTGVTPPPALAPDPASPFGIAGVMRWPDWGSFSRPADTFMQTGAAWVREDFVWGLIQPTEQRFDWTATDRIAGTLADHKINVLGIISYSANWATPAKEDDGQSSAVSFYPPDLTKYASFVRTLVTHYRGTIHYWEVWNEPNSDLFWKPGPDAKGYAALLKVAYKAIKEADPTAKVLSGGLSGNAVPYLEQMLAAGAGDSFDILALHPYAVPLNASQARAESRPEVHKMVDVELTKYRAFLDRHGYNNRPMWVTEVGWPAHDWGLDDSAQADYMAQAYAQMLASGLVERIFWYSFKDESASGPDSWGLVSWGNGKTDLAPHRPAFNAYATMARVLAGAKPAGRLQLGKYTIVEDFEQSATWNRSVSAQGAMALGGGNGHSGKSGGKLDYNFTTPNQAVDFAPTAPKELPGKPTRLGLWVHGDGSGDYLSAWLKDRDGELFKVRFGAVSGAADGWRYYESRVNNYYFDWERAGGNPANGVPDYPLQFVGFRLENTPDEPAGSGTIYVDDLQSFDGPDVSAVRFNRSDGQVVDVLWSVDPATVQIPTHSSLAQQFSRDGAATNVPAADGVLTLKVSSSPIYVVHKPGNNPLDAQSGQTQPQPVQPAQSAQPTPPANQTTQNLALQSPRPAACAAADKASASGAEGSRYFPETGHNLGGVFRTYWEAHGGLAVLGYPITEEFTAASSNGKEYRQQYFERARLEYHPEYSAPYDVLVGLLGTWVTDGRTFPPSAQGAPGANFYPQTGQSIALFKDWYASHGGLAVFGYPISPELQERNAADGKTYTVQYFERNRLEYHPEYAGSDQSVLLGLLGVEYLSKAGCK